MHISITVLDNTRKPFLPPPTGRLQQIPSLEALGTGFLLNISYRPTYGGGGFIALVGVIHVH